MKKKFNISLIVIALIFLCTGCDGNVTRDIRHAGFTLSGSFKCDNFLLKNKETGQMVNRIRYLTGTHIIDENGKIFELSLSKKYMDGQNCYDIGSRVYIQAIFDNKVVKSADNNYYYLVGQNNNTSSYSAVPKSDSSYNIYDLLLKASDVSKVMTVDSSKGLYYVLKRDGNVYGYSVSSSDRNTPPKITSTQIVYDKSDYNGAIIDFNYDGNSLHSFVRTSDKIFRMKMANGKECTQYARVECEFQMEEDITLEKYYNRIIGFSGSVLITDYGKVFTVSS